MQHHTNGRTILVGEDEVEVRGYLEMALKYLGYSVELAADGDEVISRLESSGSEITAVVLDIMMPKRDGLETLAAIRAFNPQLPVIIVSGAPTTLNVVTAMKIGATDFLSKPVAHEDLRKTLNRALETESSATASRKATPPCKTFMGSNPRMKQIQALITQIGWSEAPVLIQGETGSGKEVIARELHAQSPRAEKPFLKLNCAALPSELVESELFGYERGAFTGAFQKKAGMFELADGGTILLDEIGDMDTRLQAKLLQVLQDQEFHRIGGSELVRVDVRVMAATHRDLEKAIAENTFREDLYYRLNVITLQIPPLRERPEDILPLAEFLLKKHAVKGVPIPMIPVDLRHAMTTYHWPGNVRELENYTRKLMIMRDPEGLTHELQTRARRKPLVSDPAGAPSEIAEKIAATPKPGAPAPILEQVTKAKQQAEIEAIMAALHSTRWNRKEAAALLKIDYKALLYKMKKLGVEVKPATFAAGAESSRRTATAAFGD